jgi:hypothetical protein
MNKRKKKRKRRERKGRERALGEVLREKRESGCYVKYS